MDVRALVARLQRRRPPRVGLALSGGGVRGLAHIGVLKVLTDAGIPIHCVAGTSAGGLIGALFAAGMTPQKMEEEALRMASPRRILPFLNRGLPFRGLLSGQKVYEYLEFLLGDVTFDQLHIPLAVVAVDLNTGQKVVLREGRVVDAVRATIALPGLLSPVERDGQLLVDGGLVDNLPADAARQMGAEKVVAVDISTDEGTIASLREELKRRPFIPDGLAEMADVLWRSVVVMMREANLRNLEDARPDLLIRPVLPPGVTVLTGLTRAAEIIAAGEEAARAALPRLRELAGR
ncbi:MAG: patatin-like phospholipase family protein [Anaerolineae bacterium]|nr:patatin-like phospholipase family protein [Anaerolineae bacterium]MDW7992936.1 patatin-like phospholipase family protein [Anaerolineae bacterium]